MPIGGIRVTMVADVSLIGVQRYPLLCRIFAQFATMCC